MKTLIHGATLITARAGFQADVLLSDGRIEKVFRSGDAERGMQPSADNILKEWKLDPQDVRVLDAPGKYLFPGFIDVGFRYEKTRDGRDPGREDFLEETREALLGGTTTVITNGEWEEAACDFGRHARLTGEIPEEIETVAQMGTEAIAQGITSVFLTSTKEEELTDDAVYRALIGLKKVGGLSLSRCENRALAAALQKQHMEKKERRAAFHAMTHPVEVEAEAVNRTLYIAALADAAVVISHLSSEAALAEVQAARKRGQTVYVETCPQYLTLSDKFYALSDEQADRYICNPPLRTIRDVQMLWNAIQEEEIQIVSSNEWGEDSLIPGAENRAAYLYREGVLKGRINRESMCAVLSENAAKLFGLYPRKGVVAEGADADLVLLDPESGNITSVFLRGEEVVRDGEIVKESRGEFLHREKFRPLTKIKDVLYSY
ncbi:MAG: amidohydrolase family protein [Lachnospiraceae bacterium]|nr:amidohydrolase family protein [Lachnospiraceae bacterium]